MLRIVLICLVLAAGSAHATCQLGAVSGAIPWDAMTCPTDPSISGPNLNYSVTLTGPSVLSPPANMPVKGDNVMTLWVTYAAGGTLWLDQGFWSDDPSIVNSKNKQPPFGNAAGKFDSIVCQSHATTNPAGQGPWCKFSYDIQPIGASPPSTAPPVHVQSIVVTTPNGGSGNQSTGSFPAAASGQSILCGLTNDSGNFVTSMTDNAGNPYTLGANLANLSTNMRYAYAVNISGAPTAFKLNLSGTGLTRVYCDTFSGASAIRMAVEAAAAAASKTPSQAITGISANDMLWSQIDPGGSATASAGTGFTVGVNNQSSQKITTEYGVAASSGTIPIPWNLSASTASNITSLAIH